MKPLFIWFLLAACACAIPGDFDGDDVVDVNDLILITADWLHSEPNIVTAACDMDSSGVVDMNDLSAFSATWRTGYANQPPTANPVEAACTAGREATILLSGEDDLGRPLTYRFLSAPSLGHLSKRGEGQYVYYAWPESDGIDALQYVCNDGVSDSQPADCQITVTPPILDNLYLAGGSILVYDGQTVDLDGSFTITFWFKSNYDVGVIAAKRAADGPGFIILLQDGKPELQLHDAGGQPYQLAIQDRINLGQWMMLSVTHSAAGAILTNGDPNVTTLFSASNSTFQAEASAVLPDLDIANDSNLYFWSGYNNWMYWGQMDALNYYAAAKSTFDLALIMLEGRTQTAHALSPAYTVRFKIDEGTGNQILSTDQVYEGVLNDYYNWVPEDHPVEGTGDLRLRLRGTPAEHMRERR